MPTLKQPYPWFGGKSKIAQVVWNRFGKVRNYVEPFFGSGAVLLARPQPFEGMETVNDINAWLCNFWRALQADPDGVAKHADWPVSELDLHARGDWLFYRTGVAEWIERLRGDPDFYDVKSAGWWVWGQCAWIACGWGPRKLPHLGDAGMGVNRQLPHLGDAGMGVNRQRHHLSPEIGIRRKRPHLSPGRGINRQRPHLGDAGVGVHSQLLHLGNYESGEDESLTTKSVAIRSYLNLLAERLRRVRVCCGDWSRVCGPAPTVKQGLTAVFLDPPYDVLDRSDECYGIYDDKSASADVRDWCLQHQDEPLLRIALCGYEGEHIMPDSWECFIWKTGGGYSSKSSPGKDNCRRERIWFSPSCQREKTLFDVVNDDIHIAE